jgi:plastocyanin
MRRSVHNNIFWVCCACYYGGVHGLSNKQLVLCAIGIIVIGLLVFFGAWPSAQPQSSSNPTSQNGVRVPPSRPSPTAADTVTAQQADTFQLLVSYVNSGFEPKSAMVQAGDTVRFANNSTGKLWVAAVAPGSGKRYPGTSACGTSELDSCGALEPGQFWEFTFTQQGTWEFVNNFDKSKPASITVQ